MSIQASLNLCYADGLEQQVEHLESQLADAKDMIADLQKQITALHQQTAPVLPVVIAENPAPKRTTRSTKKGSTE